MTFDIQKLKTDIKQTASALRSVKDVFRESGQPRLAGQHFSDRRELKKRATILCSLRAHLRGKVHLSGSTQKEQSDLVSPWLTHYTKVHQQAA